MDCEYDHDARTQSPRLSAARLQLAVGRRGLGPRDHGGQRTQRASFVATYNAAAAAVVGHRAGLDSDAWLKKTHVKRLGTSLRGHTRVRQRRLGC